MEEKSITLAWKDLSVYSPIKKSRIPIPDYSQRHHRFQRIVQNVTGVAYPGELVAIMGSPILANSIFLQVLASKAPREVSVTGQIVVNGMEIQDMNQISGYVEKQGVFFESITVKEHLLCQARLRMDGRLRDYERKRRVQQLLEECDLERFKDSPIRRIPKILRIRLSLASELLTDPQILFCDEPNFGMDAAETNNLLQGLGDVAKYGITVICTFQNLPTLSLDTVDQIVLLAEGQLAFTGSPRNAERFFDTLDYVCPKYFSMPDFFLHTLAIHPGKEQESKQQIREICISHSCSYFMKDLAHRVDLEIVRDPTDMMTMIRAIRRPSSILNTVWILHRYFLDYYRTGSLQIFKLLRIAVTGVIIGLCFFGTENYTQAGVQARKGFLFILINECVFRSFLDNDASDLQIFLGENKAGLYDAGSYMLGKICFKLIIAALETLLVVTTSYFLAGFDPSASIFLFTCLILIITSVTSTAYVFAFTTIWSPSTHYSILNPVHVFLMVTSGMFISLSSVIPGISWFRFLSWMFYAYESLTILHFENMEHISCGPNESIPCYESGKDVLEDNGLIIGHFGTDLICLVALYAAFNLIAYFALLFRSYKL